jgi:hypothetical protein
MPAQQNRHNLRATSGVREENGMPANTYRREPDHAQTAAGLGPHGPFPRIALRRVLERRWLHYAFLSQDGELGLVANVAWLGPAPEQAQPEPRCTSILLTHRRGHGWSASQFNARTLLPLWSAFRQPHRFGAAQRLELSSTAAAPWVRLELERSSRPCTSQCAPFHPGQHLRWQSETGVMARGDWGFPDQIRRDVLAVGYHERVRGYWGWPQLGGWVFGFANDPAAAPGRPPPYAAVFTFITPLGPADANAASVMLWRDGRLLRHFPRRCVSFAVRGQLPRDSVQQVPALSNLFGVPPMAPIPRHLVIAAQMGEDRVVLDFSAEAAARVVIPSENSLRPFSVHEVIGPCRIEGRVSGDRFGFQTRGIVEFAGGAGGD